jgi:hypothetical protein
LVPGIFEAAHHQADKLSVRILGLAVRRGRLLLFGFLRQILQQLTRVTAAKPYNEREHHNYQSTAAYRHASAGHSAAIFNVVAFSLTSPTHEFVLHRKLVYELRRIVSPFRIGV